MCVVCLLLKCNKFKDKLTNTKKRHLVETEYKF